MTNDQLVRAYYYIASIPAESLNLSFYWSKDGGDGPCGCALGHIAKSAQFGMNLNQHDQPINPETGSLYHHAAAEVLGITSSDASQLFLARNCGYYFEEDKACEAEFGVKSDKEVWLTRCENYMKEHGIDYRQVKATETPDFVLVEPVTQAV